MSHPERCLNSVFYMLCQLWVKSVPLVSDLRLLWGKTSCNPLSNTVVKNACIISELYFYLLCLPGWVNYFPGVKVGSKCNRHWNDYWAYRGGNLVNPGRFYHPTIIDPSQWNSGTRITEFCYINKSIEILLILICMVKVMWHEPLDLSITRGLRNTSFGGAEGVTPCPPDNLNAH